jgi:tetratricopeptide (TPR) repeat protein
MKLTCGILLLIIASCNRGEIEKDTAQNEIEINNSTPLSMGTEKYYLQKAYDAGKFNMDVLGDYQTSLLYLDSVLILNPLNMDARRLKADSFSLLGDHLQALTIINEAIAIDSIDTKSFMNRANLFLILEREKEAVADYHRVIAMDSVNGPALESIAQLEYAKGNKILACEYFTRSRDAGYNIENYHLFCE